MIKEYRLAAGLAQKQLSELFTPPIPLDTIKKWDSGKMQPPEWVEGLIIEKLRNIPSRPKTGMPDDTIRTLERLLKKESKMLDDMMEIEGVPAAVLLKQQATVIGLNSMLALLS